MMGSMATTYAEPIKLKQGHWKRANTKGSDEYKLRTSRNVRHFSVLLPAMSHSRRCVYCSVQVVNDKKIVKRRMEDGSEKEVVRSIPVETRRSQTRCFCQNCGVMLCVKPYSGVAGTPTCHDLYHMQEVLVRPMQHRSGPQISEQDGPLDTLEHEM